ncbi:O-antigen ligase family protein [Bacillus marinisedimentorum]|uniref:O-antigen ligase family protein n=1 Tax=Bacillus marinisedimentorum TaxID=1821260 RepID=UPI0007E22532|nr:O-antigen ligase family protein [Bacillus marinisedimentorum]
MSNNTGINRTIVFIFLISILILKPAPGILLGQISVKGILLFVLALAFVTVFLFYIKGVIDRNFLSEVKQDYTLIFLFASSLVIIISTVAGSLIEPQNKTIMNITELYRIVLYMTFYLIAKHIKLQSANQLFKSFVILVLVVEVFGIMQFTNLFNVNNNLGLIYTPTEAIHNMLISQHRVISTFLNPNLYGSFLVIVISLLLSYLNFYKADTVQKKILLSLLIAITITSVFLTTSRTAVITAAGLIMYWLLFNLIFIRKELKRIFMLWLQISILFVLVFLVLVPNIKYLDYAANQIMTNLQIEDNNTEESDTDENQNSETQKENNSKVKKSLESVSSFKSRYDYWQMNYEKFLQSPVLGMGPMKKGFIDFADNSYLYVLARYGIVGLTLGALFIGYLYWSTVKSVTKNRSQSIQLFGLGINLIIVGYAVMAMVAETWFNIQSMTIFFAILGLFYNKTVKVGNE